MENMTKREFLQAVIESGVETRLTEFAKEEIKKMDLKNANRTKTLSKTQIENERLKQEILKVLSEAEGGKMTASALGEMFKITTQKASALCLQLVKSNCLVSEMVKGDKKGKVKAYSITTVTAPEPTEDGEPVEVEVE